MLKWNVNVCHQTNVANNAAWMRTMTAPLPGIYADEQAFLDSVEGEISFFRSLTHARPLGKHRHFRILSVRNAILKDTGRMVHIESIWDKLRKCYNIDALEAIVSVRYTRFREFADAVKELEAEHPRPSNANATATGAGTTSAAVASTSSTIHFPFSASQNLARHPFFLEEFSLPYEEFESLFAQRRLRETASLPSSPAPMPATAEGAARPASVATANVASRRPSLSSLGGATTRAAKRKIGKSRLNLAGLVGGDSDSSALTQESGDEAGEEGGGGRGVVGTPKESIAAGGTGTGTDADGRTEDGDEEDVEVREVSSGQALFKKFFIFLMTFFLLMF